jgi:hypothetical protein
MVDAINKNAGASLLHSLFLFPVVAEHADED